MVLALIHQNETPGEKRKRYVDNITAHWRETVQEIVKLAADQQPLVSIGKGKQFAPPLDQGFQTPRRSAGVVQGKLEIPGLKTVAGIGHEVLDDVPPAPLRPGVGVQEH